MDHGLWEVVKEAVLPVWVSLEQDVALLSLAQGVVVGLRERGVVHQAQGEDAEAG